MLFVEDGLGPVDVEPVDRVLAPGQVKAGIQIGADDRRLLAAALHAKEPVRLLEQLLTGFLGQRELGDAAAVLLGLDPGVLALVQLGGDGAHLLAQVVIPLVFVHLVVDLFVDLPLEAEHLVLPAQQLQQLFQAADEGVLLENGLPVLIFEQDVGGDVLAEEDRA